jgi:hypothetical protein
MVVLVCVVLFLGVLYWWLVGHWFARVVMLFPLAALLGFLGLWAGAAVERVPGASALGLMGCGAGFIAAWFASGIPIYYHRYRTRQ